jgi:hypothetical protein
MLEQEDREPESFWQRVKEKASQQKNEQVYDDYIDVLKKRIDHYDALAQMHAQKAKEHTEARKVCENKIARIKENLVDLMAHTGIKKLSGKTSRATLTKRKKLTFVRPAFIEDLENMGEFVQIKRKWASDDVPDEIALKYPELVSSIVHWNEKAISKDLESESPDERLFAIAFYDSSLNVQFYMETGK